MELGHFRTRSLVHKYLVHNVLVRNHIVHVLNYGMLLR